MKLRTKMMVWILTVVVLVFVAGLGTLSCIARSMLFEEARDKAEQMAWRHSGWVTERMEEAADVASSIRDALLVFRKSSGEIPRESFTDFLREVVRNNPSFFGVYTAWEPHVFDGKDAEYMDKPGHDDTGRYVPWVAKARERSISNLATPTITPMILPRTGISARKNFFRSGPTTPPPGSSREKR